MNLKAVIELGKRYHFSLGVVRSSELGDANDTGCVAYLANTMVDETQNWWIGFLFYFRKRRIYFIFFRGDSSFRHIWQLNQPPQDVVIYVTSSVIIFSQLASIKFTEENC